VAIFLLTYGYTDQDLRAAHRDEHLAHLNKLKENGSLAVAGPHEDQTGGAIVLVAESLAAAEELVAADPFTKAGVTKDRYLREWRITVGSF
jgi:uncharacterized protein YciI